MIELFLRLGSRNGETERDLSKIEFWDQIRNQKHRNESFVLVEKCKSWGFNLMLMMIDELRKKKKKQD